MVLRIYRPLFFRQGIVAGKGKKKGTVGIAKGPGRGGKSGQMADEQPFGDDHAKAALKIQTRARVRSDATRVEKLKAEGMLPGQVRARKIEEWGAATFSRFANAEGKITKKELTAALKMLPRTKPKKAMPGTKFQSIDEMIESMDADGDGEIDEAEWLVNLKACPGLAAALAENVEAAGTTVTADEIHAVKAEDFGDEHRAAALKIQTRARVRSEKARVEKLKAEGGLPGQQRARAVAEWGMSVFAEIDVNGDGKLSRKELSAALARLPKTKPKKALPGSKFQSLDDMMTVLGADAEGMIDQAEWLENLKHCPGLAAALVESTKGAGGPQVTAEDIDTFDMAAYTDEHAKAALKMQALQRGRQTRKVLASNTVDGARAVFAERNAMRDAHMGSSVLVRPSHTDPDEQAAGGHGQSRAAEQAHEIAQRQKREDEMAATKMQSMYRGFRDRKQVRSRRESAEEAQRSSVAQEQARLAEEVRQKNKMQASFTAGGQERSYIVVRSGRGGAAGVRRGPADVDPAAPKTALTPTLVDKKANMSETQKKACVVLEDLIVSWATSYARGVELAPGADKTGALEFVALFSKPSKEEPIAWPVVRVFFSMRNDFESQIVPRVRGVGGAEGHCVERA